MEKEPKIYEIGYLLTPLLLEEKLDEEISVLRGIIEKKQGLITNEERAKMLRLAYEIEKPGKGNFNSAYFGWIKFMANPSLIDEIKNELGKNENVIRFIVIESAKEEMHKKALARPARRRVEPQEKKEIKEEEIDKKLKELIGA